MHIVRWRALGAMLAMGIFSQVWACSSNDNKASTPLTLNASVGTGAVSTVTNGVKADGISTVTISVSGGMTAPIKVTTPRGSFTGGQKTATIASTSGSVDFVACDARTDRSCAGSVVISALDGQNGYGEITVDLIGFEASCTNGLDSNKDTRIGCADPDCDTKSCSASGGVTGTCTSGACIPPVCTPTGDTEVCDNGLDDDCDHQIDCAATACDGQACKSGSPTFLCRSKACTDIGSGYAITVTSARTRLPANGTTTTTVTAKVTKQTVAQADTVVSFAVDLGGFIGASQGAPISATTGTDGTATVTYQASATAGTATITAGLRDVPQVSQTAFIVMPSLGSITIGSIQTQVMGVKSSGFNEQNSISVLVLDTEQKPYPDGLAVRFEHQQLGNSAISTPFAPDTATCLAANGCVAFVGQVSSPPDTPDTTGLAAVNLYSGTAAGPVSINVTATAGGVGRNFTVQNIAIVGAKASSLHISLNCTPDTIPGLLEQDCLNSKYTGPGLPIICTVRLADRFNNVLGVATRADFRTEAGAAGPPVATTAYDPTLGGDQSAAIGHASDSVLVTGYSLPADVGPIAGEFSSEYAGMCGLQVHNPRDGLDTVIVSVQGEEGFVDTNGNGVYDLGEPFFDSGEPFVDVDDNNKHDINEPFIDVNQNGIWDGPNGKWDANTVIWAETRILYTGLHEVRWINLSDHSVVPAATQPVSFSVDGGTPGPATSQIFQVFISDENFNPPSAAVTSHAVKSNSGNATPTIDNVDFEIVSDTGVNFIQQLCSSAPPDVPVGCSNICRTSPCYRVTSFGGFAYGWHAQVTIKGGTAGDDQMIFTTTVDNTVLTTSISGHVN
jgi:hypothetical protein